MKRPIINAIKYILDLARFFIFSITDFFAIKKSKLVLSKNLLLVRLDAIGDYVLFRNFIEFLKRSEKYKDYKITLCGNIVWKNLVEEFDKEFIHDFIWVERKKFLNNPFYRYKILKKISQRSFEVSIQPTYSREFFVDTIIKASNAKEKIGNSGDPSNIIKWQKKISDKYYTKLLPAKESILFEFYRNKEFFEQLLKTKIDLKKPTLDVKKRKSREKYIVLFTRAGAKIREWSQDNFKKIYNYLTQKYNLKVVLINKEFHSLSKLVNLIANAELLISNETCAVHIAAGTNTRTICISNGNHFGRFTPYPKEIYKKIISIYPKNIMNKIDDYDYLCKKYGKGSVLDINIISVGEVKQQIDKILSK